MALNLFVDRRITVFPDWPNQRSREDPLAPGNTYLTPLRKAEGLQKSLRIPVTNVCDTLLFLGGKEGSTLKEISETLGKETIDLYNTSDTRGQGRSYGMNYQKTGKELMSKDELAVMDGGKCILQLRGVRPFLSDKYDITKHPNYKKLAEYDRRNGFNVESYIRARCTLRKKDVFEWYAY